MRDIDIDIAVVRWPDDDAVRTLLIAEGRPRVLVLAGDVDAPPPLDDLEDWLREPVDPVELLARSDAVRRRAADRLQVPYLDEDGLLHFADRWVAIPDSQLPMMRLLVERFGRLVRSEELAAAYAEAGGTGNGSSARTAIARMRGRVTSIGLTIEAARRRGFVLHSAR